jgi:inner membrane protein
MEGTVMLGKSHLLVGLSSAVVLDSYTHLSGPPLITQGTVSVPLSLVINKGLFYGMVALGSLLPDIDNAHSTLGRKLGWVSKGIQRLAGHRTIFHSLLGLGIGVVLGYLLESYLHAQLLARGYPNSAQLLDSTHMILLAVLFGATMHIAADGLTEGGVPLLWPLRTRFGFPPNPRQRFRTGTWPEHVIVITLLILVGIGLYNGLLTI